MTAPIAYLPLNTFPDSPPDEALIAALEFAAALGCKLEVTLFTVDVPRVNSPLGSWLVDVPGLIKASEDKSKAECLRLEALVGQAAGAGVGITRREALFGAAFDLAAEEARLYDLAILPWAGATIPAQDMAQAVVFGSGRPVVMVPAGTAAAKPDHIALAWDGSRVAARALGDALPLLSTGGRLTVLSVTDEKPMAADQGARLVSALRRRGFAAEAVSQPLSGRPVGTALQQAARNAGAQMLAMGGFGHSRLRDFVLGGATRDVLTDLHLPVMLSH
jgi:nucleotide-binding universal stress UspA family protein